MVNQNTRLQLVFVRIAVFMLLHAGTHISLLSKQSYSTSEIYLPSSLSLVFIYWFGPRLVLPLTYLNSVASAYLWGHPLSEWPNWFFYGLPEIVFPFVSCYLFAKVLGGKYWLPDLKQTILFLLYGVLVPAFFEAIALQGSLLLTDKLPIDKFWGYVFSNVLTEFTTTFIVTLPIIYYLTPVLARRQIIKTPATMEDQTEASAPFRSMEILMVFFALAVLMFYFEFTVYWYLYGFISFYVGMRFGFGPVIATNLFTMVVAYLVPHLILRSSSPDAGERDLTTFFFTTNSMFIFSVLNARVITDLRLTQGTLKEQNLKLEHTNKELDKFIYSVSHDLTAPLKSILGLVRIGRLTHDPKDLKQYLDRIEKSVVKLENFIRQALDYSRNARLSVNKERIDLRELCNEVIENVKFNPEAIHMEFQFDFRENVIFQDRDRLKVILNNLVSNAVKYTGQSRDRSPYVKIASAQANGTLLISVEDNGEGIRPEDIERIFQMFYRGNDRSWGSGLGLYIARETAKSLNGEIKVSSRYGEGSTFTVSLPM
jgi:two-component system, sensor histidine kinase